MSKECNITREQFAIYEKTPSHGKDKDSVILGSFNTIEEVEQANVKYGYNNENYYIDKLK